MNAFVHEKRKRGMTLEEKFWRNVSRTDDGECWIYGNFGTYGRIRLGGAGSKYVGAHRVSYLLHFGHCPDELVVMHKCDNPRCVNPQHLMLGTAADNYADMAAKKRSKGEFKPGPDARRRRGSAHPGSKLTEDEAKSIKADGRSSHVIAEEYGVSRSLVQLIKRGRAWRHV